MATKISDFISSNSAISGNPYRYKIDCNKSILYDDGDEIDIKFEEIPNEKNKCYFDIIHENNLDGYKDKIEAEESIDYNNIPCNATIYLEKTSVLNRNNKHSLCSLTIYKDVQPIDYASGFDISNYTFKKNIFLKCPNNYMGYLQSEKYPDGQSGKSHINICLKNCNDGGPFSLHSNQEPRCAYEPSGSFEK